MATAIAPFQHGEYIILTRPYHGFPAGSVGAITAVEATAPLLCPVWTVHAARPHPTEGPCSPHASETARCLTHQNHRGGRAGTTLTWPGAASGVVGW